MALCRGMVIRFQLYLTLIRMRAAPIHTGTVTAAARTHTTEVSATPSLDSTVGIGVAGVTDTDATIAVTAMGTVAGIHIGALTGIEADMAIAVVMDTAATPGQEIMPGAWADSAADTEDSAGAVGADIADLRNVAE